MYVPEEFTQAESDILRRYFTNLDQPVFALVNLPEVVKGALFARYSRSPRSLRRLFLDEFVGETPWAHLDIAGPMWTNSDSHWLQKGATAYGTRLLIDLALTFKRPGR